MSTIANKLEINFKLAFGILVRTKIDDDVNNDDY